MGFFRFFRRSWDNFTLWLSLNKAKFLLTTLLSIVGFVVGCIIFTNCYDGLWHANRCSYANLLLRGNFLSAFATVAFELLLISATMIVSRWHKYLFFLPYLVLFVDGIYCGAYISCLLGCIGALAVLFLIFYVLLKIAVSMLPCLGVFYPMDYCRSFGEIWQDCKTELLIMSVVSLARFLLLFLFLRPICGSI